MIALLENEKQHLIQITAVFLQGKYQRDGVLQQSEVLNKQAAKYVQKNTVVKGKPNLTAESFCPVDQQVFIGDANS